MILHLFKKVYLAFDLEINPHRSRMVFSDIQGNPMSDDLKSFFFGRLHEFSGDIENLVGSGKKFESYIDFFDHLNELQKQYDERLFIYCDINSYGKIVSNWFKLIFENIDLNSCLKIIELNFLKRKLLATRNTSITTLSIRSGFYDKMLETKNSFENSFNNNINLGNNQKINDFYQEIKQYLSIEYMLSTYLYNKKNKDMFKVVLEKMLNRMLEDVVKEIVLNLFDIIMIRKNQIKIGLKHYTTENIFDIFEDPILKDLFETNTWRFPDEEGNFERVDFRKISLEKKNEIKRAYNLIIRASYNEASASENYEHNRLEYMYYLTENGISDEDLNKIIENECQFEIETTLWSAQDQESVNLFFAQMLMEKYSENNLEALKPFVLRS
jgi:hypothetical protein